MNLNIYLPDELGARVKAAEGLNVSRVCRRALERELKNRYLRAIVMRVGVDPRRGVALHRGEETRR